MGAQASAASRSNSKVPGENLTAFFEDQNTRLSPRFRKYTRETEEHRLSFDEVIESTASKLFQEEDEEEVSCESRKCPHRTRVWGVDHGRLIHPKKLERQLADYHLQDSSCQKDAWNKDECAESIVLKNGKASVLLQTNKTLLETVQATKHCPRYGCYTWTVRVQSSGEIDQGKSWNDGPVMGFVPRHEHDFNFDFDVFFKSNAAPCFYIPGAVALSHAGHVVANGFVTNKDSDKRDMFMYSDGDRLKFVLDYNTGQMTAVRLKSADVPVSSKRGLLSAANDAIILVNGFNTSYSYNLCAGFRTDRPNLDWSVILEEHRAYRAK